MAIYEFEDLRFQEKERMLQSQTTCRCSERFARLAGPLDRSCQYARQLLQDANAA